VCLSGISRETWRETVSLRACGNKRLCPNVMCCHQICLGRRRRKKKPNQGSQFACLFLTQQLPVGTASFTRFQDPTQRRTTFGRTPLDEWSARRRDLYMTTHNTHTRQTSMPPLGFEPTVLSSERPQTYALDRAATGTGREVSTQAILRIGHLPCTNRYCYRRWYLFYTCDVYNEFMWPRTESTSRFLCAQ